MLYAAVILGLTSTVYANISCDHHTINGIKCAVDTRREMESLIDSVNSCARVPHHGLCIAAIYLRSIYSDLYISLYIDTTLSKAGDRFLWVSVNFISALYES